MVANRLLDGTTPASWRQFVERYRRGIYQTLLSRSDRACTNRHEPWSRATDHRVRILGIAALSGPSNLSRSQWTSRTALPTGFKRIPLTAGGKYRSALFDRCTRPLVSRTSPTSRTGTESIPEAFTSHSNITTSILSLYIIKSYSSPEHCPAVRARRHSETNFPATVPAALYGNCEAYHREFR